MKGFRAQVRGVADLPFFMYRMMMIFGEHAWWAIQGLPHLSLKTRQPLEKGHCFYNFNSIKVQLKQTGHYQKRGAVQFQFHKGTIKTLCNAREMKGNADFNSIKVQLKLLLRGQWKPICFNFNSIKVQLKLVSVHLIAGKAKFQFHKGTIKTRC